MINGLSSSSYLLLKKTFFMNVSAYGKSVKIDYLGTLKVSTWKKKFLKMANEKRPRFPEIESETKKPVSKHIIENQHQPSIDERWKAIAFINWKV